MEFWFSPLARSLPRQEKKCKAQKALCKRQACHLAKKPTFESSRHRRRAAGSVSKFVEPSEKGTCYRRPLLCRSRTANGRLGGHDRYFPRVDNANLESLDFGWRENANPIAELRVAPHILRVDEIRLLLSQDVVLARRRAWVFPARRAQRLVVGVWDPNSKR